MTDTALAEATRRHLTARQVELVDRLAIAAIDEVQIEGYDGLTVRGVARRAGVAPATAYTYFSSKDHLLAEVMWRRFQALPEPPLEPTMSTAQRATVVLRHIGTFMANDPALAGAGTNALLGSGPDVKALRDRIGAEIHHRLRVALGEEANATVLWALELAYTGAMLWAGMGNLAFAEVPERLADVARLILGGTNDPD